MENDNNKTRKTSSIEMENQLLKQIIVTQKRVIDRLIEKFITNDFQSTSHTK